MAWVYPPSSPGWMKVRDFSFGAGNGTRNGLTFGMELPDELEKRLKRWADDFRNDDFTEDASSEGVVAYSLKPKKAVEHIELLELRLGKVISDLAGLKQL